MKRERAKLLLLMRKCSVRIALAIVGWLASLPLAKPEAQQVGRVVVLRVGHMLDVERGRWIDDAVIVIRGERIVEASARKSAQVPREAEMLEFPNAWVLPGLIDLHVHLAWGQATEKDSLPGAAEAKATLRAGFTTVRNLGSTDFADVRLRDAIRAGKVTGPRMVVAAAGLGVEGGVCDRVFGGAARVRGEGEAAKVVRAMVERGADQIKLCAGGGVVPSSKDADATEFSFEELQAIVREAHRLDRKVAAHAQGPMAVANALRAGVDSIEHGAGVTPELAKGMREAGVMLIPTLYRLEWNVEQARNNYAPAARIHELEAARDSAYSNFSAAFRQGVPVGLGTDATVIPHGLNAREFHVLVELGLTPLEAIRAATIRAAEFLNWQDRIGSLSPGKFADLIAVERDPLKDITALEDVRLVMLSGKIVHDAWLGPIPASKSWGVPARSTAPARRCRAPASRGSSVAFVRRG
jgi:imidazolonepropionase-like amidohydrolase